MAFLGKKQAVELPASEIPLKYPPFKGESDEHIAAFKAGRTEWCDIPEYPDYRIKAVGSYKHYIYKRDETEVYLPLEYATMYAAVMAIETIEAFKTKARAAAAAKKAATAEVKSNGGDM